jgi:hypothetical protein
MDRQAHSVKKLLAALKIIPVDGNEDLALVLRPGYELKRAADLVYGEPANTFFTDRQPAEAGSLPLLLRPLLVVNRWTKPLLLNFATCHPGSVVTDDDCRGVGASEPQELNDDLRCVGIVGVLDKLNKSDSLITDQVLTED